MCLLAHTLHYVTLHTSCQFPREPFSGFCRKVGQVAEGQGQVRGLPPIADPEALLGAIRRGALHGSLPRTVLGCLPHFQESFPEKPSGKSEFSEPLPFLVAVSREIYQPLIWGNPLTPERPRVKDKPRRYTYVPLGRFQHHLV